MYLQHNKNNFAPSANCNDYIKRTKGFELLVAFADDAKVMLFLWFSLIKAVHWIFFWKIRSFWDCKHSKQSDIYSDQMFLLFLNSTEIANYLNGVSGDPRKLMLWACVLLTASLSDTLSSISPLHWMSYFVEATFPTEASFAAREQIGSQDRLSH